MEEVKMMLEVSHLTKFILAECAPANENDTFYYRKVLENLCQKLGLKNFISSDDNLEDSLYDAIVEEYEKCIEWLSLGIVSLYSFIQSNWTGPDITDDIDWLVIKRDEAAKELALGDQCNDNVKHLEFLYLAKLLFSNQKIQKQVDTSLWWFLRASMVHQLIMEEESEKIFKSGEEIIDDIMELKIWNIQGFEQLSTLFNIEAAQFYLMYRNVPKVEKYLNKALNGAKLELELDGAMGKRTRYQAEEKAQLFLKISAGKENFKFDECPHLPQSVHLNDDLRLENIKFTEDYEIPKLGTIEEAIVMAKCMHLQISQPKDHLANEEVFPYLNTIIENTKSWPLKMESLRQRCLLEMRDKRTIERCLGQSESLITQYNHQQPSVFHRTYLIFASGMAPNWHYNEILADTMLSLGLIKGALDIYIKIHQWEQVIVCYTLLELRHKAAEVIRQEIAKKPTVKLWCLLGDAEQETSHYETAWKLSNQKSSRAQRHWGMYYFAKQNYDEAVKHLEISASLNNIQENVWIRLGFAALQIENWKLAAKAYRHYCALEQTNFEAWNNLAKAYIKLGDKKRAWLSLQDAVKCNYEKWEVWDNLMVVSIDLGYFHEAVKCYHRILDLKGKHIDIEILSILCHIIEDNIQIHDGCRDALLHKGLELFGRITSMVQNNSEIWKLYALLTLQHKNNDEKVEYSKATQYLARAYRSAVANPRWFKDVGATKRVIELCNILADTNMDYADICEETRKSTLGSAKLTLQSVITKVKGEVEVRQMDNSINTGLDSLEEKLKVVIVKLEDLKEST